DSDRRNPSTVCCGDRCARLSNHLAAIISALAPTDVPLPSISTSARTNTCTDELITTLPNRNGFANGIDRSKREMSFMARRGGIAASLVQRALGEEMLADPLHQFGE